MPKTPANTASIDAKDKLKAIQAQRAAEKAAMETRRSRGSAGTGHEAQRGEVEKAAEDPSQDSSRDPSRDPTGHMQQLRDLKKSTKMLGARIDFRLVYHGTKVDGVAQGIGDVRRWCAWFLGETPEETEDA